MREQGSGSALHSPLCASFAHRSGLDQYSIDSCCPVFWIGPLNRDVKRWRFRAHPIFTTMRGLQGLCWFWPSTGALPRAFVNHNDAFFCALHVLSSLQACINIERSWKSRVQLPVVICSAPGIGVLCHIADQNLPASGHTAPAISRQNLAARRLHVIFSKASAAPI